MKNDRHYWTVMAILAALCLIAAILVELNRLMMSR